MGRGKAYSEAQLLVINAECEAGAGYRKIMKKRPGLGFAKRGLENAIRKITSGDATRKVGTGMKKTKRTDANIKKVKNMIGAKRGKASCRKIMASCKLKRTTVRNIISRDLDMKPLKTISGQRLGHKSTEKR